MRVWIDGGPRRSRRTRATRALAVTAMPVLVVVGAFGGAALVTSEVDDPSLVEQHSAVPGVAGNTAPGSAGGHGRGMSQLGAFEFAKQGWSAEQILARYYPGTSVGAVHTGLPITVNLSAQRSLNVVAPAGAIVAGQQVSPGQAVSIDAATATIYASCGGPALATVPVPDATISPLTADQSQPAENVLRFCDTDTGYRGSLLVRDGRVLNVVGIEDYVRSVVSVESSPGWADQGGTAALQAQAIAARSYALVRGAQRGDTFDDTQASQVYGGVDREDPRSDAAVASTTGLVMSYGGVVYETEYGASRADDPAPTGG